MAVNFGAAAGRAFSFAKDASRLLLLSVFYIIAGIALLSPAALLFKGLALQAPSIATLVQVFAGFLAALIVAGLAMTFIVVTLIHNYASRKSLSNSASFAKSVYLKFLAGMIVLIIIHMLLGLVPFIGFILTIIVSIALFTLQPGLVLGRHGVFQSFSASYSAFKRNKLAVFTAFVIMVAIELAIVFIFAIPFIATGLLTVFSAAGTGQLTAAVASKLPLLAVTGVIMAVGFALATLFATGFQTDVYLQLSKKRKQK